jgi:hypothetical protein
MDDYPNSISQVSSCLQAAFMYARALDDDDDARKSASRKNLKHSTAINALPRLKALS